MPGLVFVGFFSLRRCDFILAGCAHSTKGFVKVFKAFEGILRHSGREH